MAYCLEVQAWVSGWRHIGYVEEELWPSEKSALHYIEYEYEGLNECLRIIPREYNGEALELAGNELALHQAAHSMTKGMWSVPPKHVGTCNYHYIESQYWSCTGWKTLRYEEYTLSNKRDTEAAIRKLSLEHMKMLKELRLDSDYTASDYYWAPVRYIIRPWDRERLNSSVRRLIK